MVSRGVNRMGAECVDECSGEDNREKRNRVRCRRVGSQN